MKALALLLLLTSSAAIGGERWHRVAEVPAVDIALHIVTELGLAAVQERKRWQFRGDLWNTHRLGHARLYRNRSSGAFRCDVFVTAATNRADVLEHETRHCYGWAH